MGRLRDHSHAADDVFYLVWDGWGDVPRSRWPGAAEIDHRWRRYWLLRGSLSGAMAPLGIFPDHGQRSAQLWWSANRAWLVATEIDFMWTYVTGDAALVDLLLTEPRLETVQVA